MKNPYFLSEREDALMEENATNAWQLLLLTIMESIRARKDKVHAVLDVGCHWGGLLFRMVEILNASELYGIEPLQTARAEAVKRLGKLRKRGLTFGIFSEREWSSIPVEHIDLVVCHEAIHLIDRDELMRHIALVLRPGGKAYIVTSCHTESKYWMGHLRPKVIKRHRRRIVDHSPFQICQAAMDQGLRVSFRPLFPYGWISYESEREAGLSSARKVMEHHYRDILVFRITKPT